MSAIASTAARHADTELDRLLAELAAYRSCDPPRLSLPPRAFTSPELYELERTRVFGRSWMLVAHRDELASPGDYVSLTIAGEPVVVTRDEDGALHAMSPVCRHRLMPLVEPGHGRADDFTCPYHLWKYRLDGRLKGATFMKGNPDFDPAACRLPGFAVEEWQGLVYVNLDAGAPSLASRLAPAAEELAPFRMDEMVQVVTVEEEWRVNWKLTLENGYENYHVMGFHPETLDPFMPGRGDMELHPIDGGALWARMPFAATLPRGAVPLPREHRANATVMLTFPTGGLITFGDQITWLSFIPLSIDRTQVRGGVLMPPALLDGLDPQEVAEEQTAAATAVNEEDRIGLEAVQRAVGSRFAGRGHLSPKEPGVLLFYRALAEALVPEETPGRA